MKQVLFHIGSYPVKSHGLMTALGLLLGTWLAYLIARRRGKFENDVLDFTFYAGIAGVIGSRLWEVAFTWEYYRNDPLEILAIWHGGLSVQGAVVAGLLVAIWYARKHGLPFWQFADVLTPGVLLGQAVGRAGCFLDGDAFGLPTSSFLGVVYPPGTAAYAVFGPVPLWPAELFEGIWDLILTAGLLLYQRKKPAGGRVFLWYVIAYSVGRFSLEFLRGDSLRTVFGWKAAQLTSVIAALAAALFMWMRSRQAA